LEDVGLAVSSDQGMTFDLIRRCVELDNAAVCFVPQLDSCIQQIAFAIPGHFKARLVGTLFQPVLHYPTFPYHRGQDWPPRFRGWIYAYLISFLACHRDFVSEILVLDPLAPDFYNKILRTTKFRYLPDYVLHLDSPTLPREYFGIPQERNVFLFAGSIANRKGAREFVAAIRCAFAENAVFRSRSTIVFAGRILESREVICNAVEEFTSLYPDASVFLFDRHLTDQEFVSLVAVSDVVCVPYIQFAGMASLLVHAAAYGHPVIGPRYGLLGELIRRYNLGLTCDPADPAELKDALYKLPTGDPESRERQREALFAFGAGRSLQAFGQEICDSIRRAVRQSESGKEDVWR
jgi:glycosyltransferase involved in cell wall biosynthesis